MSETETTQPLHIKRYDFNIPLRYFSGHTIDAAEAQALNQQVLENVRNNVASWVKDEEAKSPDGVLSLSAHAKLQEKIFSYAEAYQFQLKKSRRPLSAIDAAIDELAMAQAELEGNEKGFMADSPEVLLRYRQLLRDPEIRIKARKVVLDRTKITKSSLEDILGSI